MPTQLWITAILNHLFAKPADALLALVHVTPKYPDYPITNTFAMELIVFLGLLAYFVIVRASPQRGNTRRRAASG